MARCYRVTITGADDSTSVQDLVDLSKEFPFVEWAILVSASQEGDFRFPSRSWQQKYCTAAIDYPLKTSMHLCGRWVRELLKGELNVLSLPPVKDSAQRIQINTHAEPHISTEDFVPNTNEFAHNVEWIMQADGVNGHLADVLYANNKNHSILFDMSHGAGVVPDKWPKQTARHRAGYAGGLGPDNVLEQLYKIEEASNGYEFWIDMERRVRTEDDSALDMNKVHKVLSLMKPEMLPYAGL